MIYPLCEDTEFGAVRSYRFELVAILVTCVHSIKLNPVSVWVRMENEGGAGEGPLCDSRDCVCSVSGRRKANSRLTMSFRRMCSGVCASQLAQLFEHVGLAP